MPRAQVKLSWPWTGTVLCVGFYALLAATFLELEMVQPAPTPGDPRGGDLLAYYYPMLKYGFAQLRSGQLPLWDPYQSCGTPFLAVPNIGLFYPLYLPYLLLDAATAFNLDVAVHLLIASTAMFLLCRHFKMERGSALVAGVVYAYSGSMLLKVYFPNFIAPVVWIPLIFLLVDRILRGRAWWPCAALAAVVGATLLGGNVQFSYFTALALIPFVATRSAVVVWKRGARALVPAYGGLMLAALLALLVAAVRVLPAAEYMAETWRPPGSLDVHAASVMAIAPRAFAMNLFTPGPPAPSPSLWSGADVEREAYVGVAPMVLALVGLLLWKKRSVSLPIACAGIAAAFYSFGSRTPFYPLLFKLPGGSWFRGLDRALIIFAFASAFLCGAGLDVLLRSRQQSLSALRVGIRAGLKNTPRALLFGTALVVLLLGLGVGDQREAALLASYWGFGVAILGALSFLGARVPVRATGVSTIAVLIICDLFHAHRYPGVLPSQLGGYLSRYDALFDQIRGRQGFDRTYIWSSMASSSPLPFYSDVAKAGLLHGIWVVTDYEPLSTQRMESYLAALGAGAFRPMGYHTVSLSRENVGLFDLMGVRYTLMQTGQEAKVVDKFAELSARWKLLSTKDGVSVYERPDAMPRTFVVNQVEVEPQPDRLLARLKGANLRQVAFVEESLRADVAPQSGETGAASEVEIAAYGPQHVTISATVPNGGFLVLTDQYYPGWRALVDGAPTRIYRADYLFRGVQLPPGTHRVEFVYRPASFYLGVFGSVIGVAGILLLLALPRRPSTGPNGGAAGA